MLEIRDASRVPTSPSSIDSQASCRDQDSGEAYSGTESWGSRQTDVLDQHEQGNTCILRYLEPSSSNFVALLGVSWGSLGVPWGPLEAILKDINQQGGS